MRGCDLSCSTLEIARWADYAQTLLPSAMKLSSTIPAALLLLAAVGIALRLSPKLMQSLAAGSVSISEGQSLYVTLVPESIDDGDTFRVTDGSRETEVNLCGVIAPEIEQPIGIEARDRLRQMIARGNGQVILVPVETDPDGRMVAEAFVPLAYSVGEQKGKEIHLNSQMLLDGMAYPHPQDISSCPNAAAMQTAKHEAETGSVGVWHSAVGQRP